MKISKKLDYLPVRDAIVAHRYENMALYVSLVAFLAMATIFFMILSL